MLLTQPRSSTSEVRLNVINPDRHRETCLRQTDVDSLQKLAIQARTDFYPTQAQQRRAMDKLLDALRFSGRLRGRGQYPVDVYDDAVNRTLCWVAFHIDQFNPEQGDFFSWVNYRLDILLREAKAETLDPLVKAQYAQIIRRKYQLTVITSQVGKAGLGFWLTMRVKGIRFNHQIISWLAILCQLSQLRMVNRTLSERIFLDLAKMSLSLSPLRQVDEESLLCENLAQPEKRPCLSELIKEYIESDPNLLSRHHVQNCPKATLNAILKARLEDRSWQEIADSFSLTIAAVKNFFSRQMKTVAPLIGQEILS
jgi:hypothetical protein